MNDTFSKGFQNTVSIPLDILTLKECFNSKTFHTLENIYVET